ncbi:hypothetical protein BY996DRAFT_6605057 [Phakopsora pachyrhizi]|nr:hypothetical protein BY996DRAFT_6605057 [Phakopsora pachyrhizi]
MMYHPQSQNSLEILPNALPGMTLLGYWKCCSKGVVEGLVKEGREEGGAKSAPGLEGVAVEGNEWRHWKEGQTLGGGSHQSQSGWSIITGATDL